MTLLELIQLLKKHIKLVIALPLLFSLVAGAFSYLRLPNTYTASTSMYVLAQNEDATSNTTLYSDLSAAQMITNDVATLLESDRLVSKTASDLGLESLSGYSTSVSAETNSRVITLSVTSSNAEGAASVANKMAENVSTIAREVMNVDSVNVIDSATAPTQPSGPNRPLYVAVAFLAGLFSAVALVVLTDMLNTKIRSQEEVEDLLDIPVIGRVPVMKGGIN